MLQSRLNLEMTDPEIRGDVDGFVLGSTLTSTLGVYSSMKLSQLLDMYYSPRVRMARKLLMFSIIRHSTICLLRVEPYLAARNHIF